MQLFVSTTSPFARLVLITAYRKKLDISLNFVMPWDNPAELMAVNPFCQVPTLITDSGQVITESSVILAHLAPEIFADETTAAKVSFSLGLINQAVKAFSTRKFQPTNSEPHPFIQRAEQFLNDALTSAPTLQSASDNWGEIFYGVALVYIQLRLPELFEHTVSPANQQAVSEFLQRDFMQKTAPSQLDKLPQFVMQL